MTPYRASAEDQLGAPLAEFRRARRTIVSDVVIGSIVGAMGLAMLVGAIVERKLAVLVSAGIIGAVFLGLGVFVVRRAVLDGDLLLRFCTHGLVHRHRGRTVTVPYERVRHVLIEPMVERSNAFGLHWWTDRRTLVLDDEARVELRCSFLENDRVQALLDERLAHLTREAHDALASGQSIDFGGFVVRPDGVETRHGFFGFPELSSLELAFDRESEDSSADLKVRTKAGATLLFPLEELRDVHALIDVVRARIAA